MGDRKTYAQFCALARALDRVGDRWTLLLVRELMLGSARYSQLRSGLPGIATNLLAQRLRQLELDGLVERHGEGSQLVYRLTPDGQALEPVLLALIRWGARFMPAGPDGDRVDERWALLALRALLDGGPSSAGPGQLLLRCGAQQLGVSVDEGGRRSLAPVTARPLAVVTAPLPALLAAVAFDDWSGGVHIEGDEAFATATLAAGDHAG